MTSTYDAVTARLRALRVIPVITIDDPQLAEPLADALAGGGLPCAEITFRTPRASEALRRIAKAHPDFLVGAGTVLTPDQADRARDAGARFAVAPGMNPRVVEHCSRIGLPMYPGVATPTEIEAALELGVRLVKFFPAEPMGGVPFLKAVAAPYGEMEFIPTGGITRDTVAGYLRMTRVVACGGSWMAPADWIAAKAFERIRQETAQVVALLRASDSATMAAR